MSAGSVLTGQVSHSYQDLLLEGGGAVLHIGGLKGEISHHGAGQRHLVVVLQLAVSVRDGAGRS